jgi:hypothetical protein
MTTTPSVPTTWLRVPAAAADLGLGVSTLNKLRLTGGGPRFAKLTSVVVYDLADLDRWGWTFDFVPLSFALALPVGGEA